MNISLGKFIIIDTMKKYHFEILLFPIEFKRKDGSQKIKHLLDFRIRTTKGYRYISVEILYFIYFGINFYIWQIKERIKDLSIIANGIWLIAGKTKVASIGKLRSPVISIVSILIWEN